MNVNEPKHSLAFTVVKLTKDTYSVPKGSRGFLESAGTVRWFPPQTGTSSGINPDDFDIDGEWMLPVEMCFVPVFQTLLSERMLKVGAEELPVHHPMTHLRHALESMAEEVGEALKNEQD